MCLNKAHELRKCQINGHNNVNNYKEIMCTIIWISIKIVFFNNTVKNKSELKISRPPTSQTFEVGRFNSMFCCFKSMHFYFEVWKMPKIVTMLLAIKYNFFFFSMELHIYYSYHKCLLTWLALLLPHFIFWSNHPTKYEILLSFCGNRFPVHASG